MKESRKSIPVSGQFDYQQKVQKGRWMKKDLSNRILSERMREYAGFESNDSRTQVVRAETQQAYNFQNIGGLSTPELFSNVDQMLQRPRIKVNHKLSDRL
jgi:hypothetical protein